MTNDIFKEHHPRRLIDYVGRSTVCFGRKFISKIGKNNYIVRSVVANTIASSLSFILANSLHQKIINKRLGDRDAIEDLLCESSGMHFHILVASELCDLDKKVKTWITVLKNISIFLYRTVAYFSPRAGHRMLGYIYENSISDYSNWIEKIERGDIPNTGASLIAIGYYELPKDLTLKDVLISMREDVLKFRDIEHKKADSYYETEERGVNRNSLLN